MHAYCYITKIPTHTLPRLQRQGQKRRCMQIFLPLNFLHIRYLLQERTEPPGQPPVLRTHPHTGFPRLIPQAIRKPRLQPQKQDLWGLHKRFFLMYLHIRRVWHTRCKPRLHLRRFLLAAADGGRKAGLKLSITFIGHFEFPLSAHNLWCFVCLQSHINST